MAVTSTVAICRMALSNIGSTATIESIDEDSKEASLCKIWFDQARLETLEAFDWSFARRRANLAVHSEEAPEDEWAFRYQYPDGCVSFRRIKNPLGDTADAVPFETELNGDGTQKTILTDEEDAQGIYTADITDPGLFSRHFVQTLARKLGSHIAFDITGKQEIVDKQNQAWAFMISTAMGHNANERQAKPPREAEWIRGR